ncbi:serine hydrolase [Aurantibacter crassamenti]|uniref:serine hydrolase n=1 Tax=Aurantibacter crassamenti TaxID=1837375 RepID=UPI00193948E3|nr:serine hydrolase [Aurantibacter crassamenti]MBM1107014.1 serine hydrolase [Aurantibacter crassamenti]
MKNKTGLLLLILLIQTSTSLAQQNNSPAPEATVAEINETISGSEAPFWKIAYLKEPFIDTAPKDRKDGIPLGKLGVDGGNKAMVLKLAQEIADSLHGNFDSFLIAHKGKLLFESYYLRGRVNLPHPQASATKAYTSLALGRAIQLGYLTMADLDKPLVSFFKGLDTKKFVAGVETITLHKALTMRGGLSISEKQKEAFKKNPSKLKGQGQIQALLEHSAPITPESQHFLYGNYNPALVMQVLNTVVPGKVEDFIKNEVLNKLGIVHSGWGTEDLSGLPYAGSRSSITSRDMVKLGILTANKGKWNGEQLIPEAFIAKAISRILTTGDDDVFGGGKDVSNQGYGYFWWNADLQHGNKSYYSTSAQGGGGQFIVLIEELDLMVVVTAHNQDNKTLQIIAERVLPAFIQNSNPTMGENTVGQEEIPFLQGPYLGQKPPGLTSELFAPGIVSVNGRYEGAVSFSPDLKEIYFGANNENEETAIYFSKLEDNKWTPIKRANFTKGRKKEELHPFVSPNGKRIYFTAVDSIFKDEKIWYVNRFEDSWSDALLLDSPVNDDLVFFPKQAKNGDLYYFNLSARKPYYAPNKNCEFPVIQELDLEFGHHVCISPSQDYVLVTARNKEDESRKDNDVYVCFKNQDGTWGKPINLGKAVNSDFSEKNPTITPDGKYLFFGRAERKGKVGLANIYWVSTEVIDKVRPIALQENDSLEFPLLTGPYMGQKPPGKMAEPFAPGIVTTEHRELSGFFSPDLKEFYFNRNGGSYEKHALVVFKNTDNRWKESYVMPRTGRPVFAPDGKTIHLGKKYMERTETGWSEVKSLGSYFEDFRIMRLTSSTKGTYVFDEVGSDDGDGVIRYSRFINGKHETPIPFPKEINNGKFNAHPFIAPDESYIIWDGERENGFGDSDLYISFRQKDDSWGEAINLGDKINTEAWESTAFVTPDGKYLFFNRNVGSPDYENVDIFWVDAQFIENLRP